MEFRDDISNERTDARTHGRTNKSKPICFPVFQSWMGHKKTAQTNSGTRVFSLRCKCVIALKTLVIFARFYSGYRYGLLFALRERLHTHKVFTIDQCFFFSS